MDRQTVTAVAIAVVGVLAVALAAATLTTAVAPESGLGGDGEGGGESGDAFGSPPPVDDRPADSVEVPLLKELVQLVVLLIALAVVGYVLAYRRDAVPVLVAILAAAAVAWLAAQFVSGTLAPPEPPTGGPGGDGLIGGSDGDDGSGSGETVPGPLPLPALLVLVLGVALVGVLLTIGRGSTPGPGLLDRSDDADSERTDAEPRAIGRAAGRAADRIERGDGGDDVENDVYRAWAEMTSLLAVSDPDTTSPREFETAAVEAGLDADDVRELTRLFEDVRYGGYSPTADREQRAVRVFRRIESQYAREET